MATNISPKQAEEMLKAGEAILVDVRDNDMFRTEHIVYSTSLPVEQIEQNLQVLADQPRKIIFQCMKGIKSQLACQAAKELGDKIYNMEGGLIAWKDSGLPTLLNNQATPKMPLVRQMQIILGIVLLLIFILPSIMGGLSFLGYLIPIIGIILILAGIIGCCPLIKLLALMPWNK